MIFIVRVSDSERLSYSHKIFINVKIFDSMKSTIKRLMALMVMAFSALPLVAGVPDGHIADDSDFKVGRLDNGMTYYILRNANPEGCADFYIVHNVGALQEEDNQDGLAHFLEHMAFNGTKHYPDKELLGFLAKEGVRFGYNVNAYTARTETVYNLSSIPLVRESFVDSVLMVLHDWSCDISCEQDALDAERGVISEEWRRRDDQRSRMATRQNKLIFKGGKQEKRFVIGTLDVINGFKRQEILDFYHKWYRPDLQAIIIVGDFNPEEMESRVVRMFSDIPAPVNPAPKEVYGPTPLVEPLFENMVDPEIKYYTLKVIHKQRYPARENRNTVGFYRDNIARQVATAIVEARFSKASKAADSPLKSSVLVTNQYAPDYYISLFTMSPKKEDLLLEALAFYEREIGRVVRHGISDDEFRHALFEVSKKMHLYEEMYPEDITNEMLVNVCKQNFLSGFPCIRPDELRAIQASAAETITKEEIERYIRDMFTGSERIYSYSINESKASILPSADSMRAVIASVRNEELEPDYVVYSQVDTSLSAKPGRIVSCAPAKGFDGEVWHLDNGADIYWSGAGDVQSATKLMMHVFFDTGFGACPQDSIMESKAAISYLKREAGFRGLARSEIRSTPEYGGVNVGLDIGRKSASVSVSAGAKEIETAFRMLHLQLAEPYFGSQETLSRFRKLNNSNKSSNASDKKKFEEMSQRARLGDDPWREDPDSAAIAGLDLPFISRVFGNAFGDFSNMSVYICSSSGKEVIKPLVEKYIASLCPAGNPAVRSFVRPSVPRYKGKVVVDTVFVVSGEPKTSVAYDFKAQIPANHRNDIALDILDYIMSDRYLNLIREERGGTYHVSFYSQRFNTAFPHKGFNNPGSSSETGLVESEVAFKTRPAMTDILIGDVEAVIDDISRNDPSDEEFEKAVRYLVKRHREQEEASVRSLYSRLYDIEQYVRYGIRKPDDYEGIIHSLKPSDIRKIARRLATGDRFVSVYREKN